MDGDGRRTVEAFEHVGGAGAHDRPRGHRVGLRVAAGGRQHGQRVGDHRGRQFGRQRRLAAVLVDHAHGRHAAVEGRERDAGQRRLRGGALELEVLQDLGEFDDHDLELLVGDDGQ